MALVKQVSITTMTTEGFKEYPFRVFGEWQQFGEFLEKVLEDVNKPNHVILDIEYLEGAK